MAMHLVGRRLKSWCSRLGGVGGRGRGRVKLRRFEGQPPRPGMRLLEARVSLAGRNLSLLLRRDTTDLDLVRMILCDDSEYRLPATVRPKVIFDIGANIGVTAVYFAATYPQAQIHCFEPLPDNVALLRENARRTGANIQVHAHGLSDTAGSFEYHLSDDPHSFAGGTFCRVGHDPTRSLQLPVVCVRDAIAQANVNAIDVFKIDTEGCEWPILRGIPQSVRQNAQAYIGELHGVDDWDFCRLLSDTHAVGVQKAYDRRCFSFVAVRRDLAEKANATPTTELARAA